MDGWMDPVERFDGALLLINQSINRNRVARRGGDILPILLTCDISQSRK